MKIKLLSLLLLSFLVLTGCNKSNSVDGDTYNNDSTAAEEVETISCKEILLNNYWSTISDPDFPDFMDFYNFNEDSIFGLYSIGVTDFGMEKVDNMEDLGDRLIIDSTGYTDDGGSLKNKYTITMENENTMDVVCQFDLEGDNSTFNMTLTKTSLEDIIEYRKPTYPDEEFFNSQMDLFKSSSYDFSHMSEVTYYTSEDAAQIVVDYFELQGVPCETHYLDVYEYEYNGRFGYSVTGSVDNAPMLFLYNIGEIFVDGITGEITILEEPAEDEGRGY